MTALCLNRSLNHPHPHRSARCVSLTLLLLTAFSLGCGGGGTPQVKPGPAIPGLNLSGGFDCQEFGFMKLRQTGLTLQGTYEGIRKTGDNGTIRGKIEGDLVWFDWIQPGDINAAVWPKQGKGWLRVSRDGQLLKGRWGYDQNRDDGGTISLRRSDFVFDE